MPLRLTITLLLGVLFYLTVIIALIKKEQLNLRYTLLWLFSGVVMMILAVFPQVASFIAGCMGVETPANAVFVIEALFALLIILSLTSVVSNQMLRIRKLTQTQAMLEKRVREVEEQLDTLLEKPSRSS